MGRGDAGAEQRRGDLPSLLLQRAPASSRCARPARRPRSRSTSSSPSCARTAPSTTCSPRSTRPGSTRPAARLLDKTLEEFRRAGVDQDDATRGAAGRDQRADHRRSTRSSAATSATTSAPCGSTPEQLAGLPEDWLDAHPADDDGLVTVTTDYPDAVPARMFVRDAEVRRAGHRRLPRARLAAERAAAHGALRAAPRVREPGRLRRLGVVRRRGEDDREGPGDPGVHRPDRRRPRRGRWSATSPW